MDAQRKQEDMQRSQERHVLEQTVARMARDRGDISHRSKYPFEPASSSGCLLMPGGGLDKIDFSCGCSPPSSPAPRAPPSGGTDATTRATTAATHRSDTDIIDPSPEQEPIYIDNGLDPIQAYCPSFTESAQISAEVAALKMPARPKSRLAELEENVRRMSVAIPALQARVHSPNEYSKLIMVVWLDRFREPGGSLSGLLWTKTRSITRGRNGTR